MKNNIDLHDEFVNELFKREPKRAELVKLVASSLNIEKEPASRRLNKTVLFSIREMGILARELDLSIDAILNKNSPYHMIPLTLNEPMSIKSMDELGDILELHINHGVEIASQESELGAVFDALPYEFLVTYPELLKFTLFSLGHYFITSKEFDSYSEWEVPPRFLDLFTKYNEEIFNHVQKFTYIWNDSLVWHFIRKLNYFHSMYVVSEDERKQILDALHAMLTELETKIRNKVDDPRIKFYISNINMGMTAWYHISSSDASGLLRTNFCTSALIKNREYCFVIKEWIFSLKNLSTLISGSGHKERRLFFEEQHKIINKVAGY